jgi:hypothetical protein
MLRLALTTIALVLGLTVLLPTASAAVSREQAAELAQRKAPGRVLKVEREDVPREWRHLLSGCRWRLLNRLTRP